MLKTLSIAASVLVLSVVSVNVFAADDDPAVWRQRKVTKEKAAAVGTTSEDIAEEIRFGREIAARIIGRYGLYDNDELMKYVNLVGKSVAANTCRQEIQFRFAVLNTEEVNAYAAPGGYIFITRGALTHMQDEAELAGVLAHEVAHVTQKHIVKELNIQSEDTSAASGMARLIGGTSEAARTAFAQAVDKALDMLFKDGYKREDEVEADRTGVSFSALAGYDPTGLPRYLEIIGPTKEKDTEVLDKTHPGYKERVSWLTDTIKNDGLDAVGKKAGRERFTSTVRIK
ncbi:MAG: M48 family metalloprotease [Nitrospirota bacterium]|nr:M48 family metalloprotease [Nitrospirota bacterium]